MTTIVLVGELKKRFSGLRLSARECVGYISVAELAYLIKERLNESKVHPDLVLTNRTDRPKTVASISPTITQTVLHTISPIKSALNSETSSTMEISSQ